MLGDRAHSSHRGGSSIVRSSWVWPLLVCWIVGPRVGRVAGQEATPPTSGDGPPAVAAASQPPPAVGVGDLVAEVRITGNEAISTNKILRHIQTRKDRQFDPELLQGDKRRLTTTGWFRDVRVLTARVPEGIVVTFEVFERPTIRYVRFIGDRGISERTLQKESGLEVGESLNVYAVEEARRKIENLYRSKGFPYAQVTVVEGKSPEDQGAVFYISEGPLQRIWSVDFVGNTIASDARLQTRIQTKRGFLWYLFGGQVDQDKIQEDIDRLTAYYRSLGFFSARISRQLEYDDSGKWLTLRFVIDEGPRYVVRDVSVAGNERFDTESLLASLSLRSGDHFNLDKMNADVNTLRDIYGSQGFVYCDVKADPRFLEEPGQLDLVYSIAEGDQFRVGRINVHIAGEFPHTQEGVVLDRLSIRPGDIVDIREVRASERRLKSSELFVVNPAEGNPPRIVFRTPDLSRMEGMDAGVTRAAERFAAKARTGSLPRRLSNRSTWRSTSRRQAPNRRSHRAHARILSLDYTLSFRGPLPGPPAGGLDHRLCRRTAARQPRSDVSSRIPAGGSFLRARRAAGRPSGRKYGFAPKRRRHAKSPERSCPGHAGSLSLSHGSVGPADHARPKRAPGGEQLAAPPLVPAGDTARPARGARSGVPGHSPRRDFPSGGRGDRRRAPRCRPGRVRGGGPHRPVHVRRGRELGTRRHRPDRDR